MVDQLPPCLRRSVVGPLLFTSLLAAMTSCARETPEATPEGSANPAYGDATTMLDCDYSGAGTPSKEWSTSSGAVALQHSRTLLSVEVTAGTGFRYFAKSGLAIRPEDDWRITVAPPSKPNLRLSWGQQDGRYSEISSPDCFDGKEPKWVWYPGGYWVTEPGCYSVVIETKGERRTHRLSVGTPCPPQ